MSHGARYSDSSVFPPCPVCGGPSRYTMLGGIQCRDDSGCPVHPVVFGDDDDIEVKWARLCQVVKAGLRALGADVEEPS